MQLIKQIKQSIIGYNVSRYKLFYLHITKLAICLLAINYANGASSKQPILNTAVYYEQELDKKDHSFSSSSVCYLARAYHQKVKDFIKLAIAPEEYEITKGKIALDPARLAIDSGIHRITIYDSSDILRYRQQVKGNYIYEYISNHTAGAIGENSSIYFGLTPVQDTADNYYLARFNYKTFQLPQHKYNPALTIDCDMLNHNLANNKLTSLAICSKLDAESQAQHALCILGSGSTTLTTGLIIANKAILTAGTKANAATAGLTIKESTSSTNNFLATNIINYGIIKGYYGVKINDDSNNPFVLINPDGGTTVKLHNYGTIQGTTSAVQIMGKKRPETDTCELINYHDGVIQGNIQIMEPSRTEHTINFNVVNYNKIYTKASVASIDITNYTGKQFSQLDLLFSSNATKTKTAWVKCSQEFILEKNARIVITAEDNIGLMNNISFLANNMDFMANKEPFLIVESGNIFLEQPIKDVLFTRIKDIATTTNTSLPPYKKFIIVAHEANVNITHNKKIIANCASMQLDKLPKSIYMADMVKIVNAQQNIKKSLKIAEDIEKAIDDGIEIAGMTLDKNQMLKLQQSTVFQYAKNYCNSAEEFFDILLPDSSNSQFINNYKIVNRFIEHINARLTNKSTIDVKNFVCTDINSQGIAENNIADNISMWSAFNYLSSKGKHNDLKQHYNTLTAYVFSFGSDCQLAYKDTVLGISYSFAKSHSTVYGGYSKINHRNIIPPENIKTYMLSIYSARHIKQVDSKFNVFGGFSRHLANKSTKTEHYNSMLLGCNIIVDYSIDLTKFDLNIGASFGYHIINTDEHESKDSTIINAGIHPKDSNCILSLGLMLAVADIIDLGHDTNIDYKFSLGNKIFLTTSKKNKLYIGKDQHHRDIPIEYNKREASTHEFNINTNFNIQARNNIHLGLDINYDFSKDSTAWCIATSLRLLL